MAPPRSRLSQNKSSSNQIQNSTAKIWAKVGACWEKLSSCFEACRSINENHQTQAAHHKQKNNLMMEEFDHFVGEEKKQLLEPSAQEQIVANLDIEESLVNNRKTKTLP